MKDFRIRVFDLSGRDEDVIYYDDNLPAYEKFIDIRSEGIEVVLEERVDNEYETIEYYDPNEEE